MEVAWIHSAGETPHCGSGRRLVAAFIGDKTIKIRPLNRPVNAPDRLDAQTYRTLVVGYPTPDELERLGVDKEALDMLEYPDADDDGNENQEDKQEDDMAVADMPTGKTKTKTRAKRKTSTQRKSTAAKTLAKAKTKSRVKASANGRGTFPCLCGCGETTARYFAIGHDSRFKGWLSRIAAGTHKPSDFFDAATIKKLGPWKNGVPKNSYTVLRPEL